jgi:pimeloyl-ACP methyl ester carboxylesterase
VHRQAAVVLLHGAFADASGWDAVSGTLQGHGHTVVAPAISLRDLATDAGYVRGILDTIAAPIVAVGHCYGGAVLTNAAVRHPQVAALVYIAAYAPDESETLAALTAMNPGSMLADHLVPRLYPGGTEGYIKRNRFREIFAADLDPETASVMAASQRPPDLEVLAAPSGPPAWKTIPSWFMVATQDHVIPPATQRFMARRAGAATEEVDSSHVAMMSHPSRVVELIRRAAGTAMVTR